MTYKVTCTEGYTFIEEDDSSVELKCLGRDWKLNQAHTDRMSVTCVPVGDVGKNCSDYEPVCSQAPPVVPNALVRVK